MTEDRTDIRQAVVDTANSLFTDRVTQAMLDEAETGAFHGPLWEEIASLGLPAAALPEALGGLGSLRDGAALLRPLGYHGVPLPLAESLLASWLAAEAGLSIPDGMLTLAFGDAGLSADGSSASGALKNVPWGRNANAVLVVGERDVGVAITLLSGAASVAKANVAGEPRDDLALQGANILGSATPLISVAHIRAMAAGMRAVMMAGALERILDLTVLYAKDRVQFGKPIGKFQAIQQQIAILANHTAASVMASERMIAALEEGDLMKMAAIAKVRVGEGASEGVRIAHQVHGAMGFTHDHILHHFTRRLWSWRDEQGSEAYWARKLGEQAMAGGADALWSFVGDTV